MAEVYEIHRCNICGNIVEIVNGGKGKLVCCGQEMELLKENTVDASKEKHVPVVERTATGIKVKVGGVPHPMEEKHYIQWIEVVSGGKSMRAFLKPGMVPEAEFPCEDPNPIVREYCNLHGLWRTA